MNSNGLSSAVLLSIGGVLNTLNLLRQLLAGARRTLGSQDNPNGLLLPLESTGRLLTGLLRNLSDRLGTLDPSLAGIDLLERQLPLAGHREELLLLREARPLGSSLGLRELLRLSLELLEHLELRLQETEELGGVNLLTEHTALLTELKTTLTSLDLQLGGSATDDEKGEQRRSLLHSAQEESSF